MKPDWKDAPEWANWLAMDSDGEWFWFELEPKIENFFMWWLNVGSSRWKKAMNKTSNWEKSLEQRPKE